MVVDSGKSSCTFGLFTNVSRRVSGRARQVMELLSTSFPLKCFLCLLHLSRGISQPMYVPGTASEQMSDFSSALVRLSDVPFGPSTLFAFGACVVMLPKRAAARVVSGMTIDNPGVGTLGFTMSVCVCVGYLWDEKRGHGQISWPFLQSRLCCVDAGLIVWTSLLVWYDRGICLICVLKLLCCFHECRQVDAQ